MFTVVYGEVERDGPDEARKNERTALERSIALMKVANQRSDPRDIAIAIQFTLSLWSILAIDLAKPDNLLPRDLRAQIISIGIWMVRRLDEIRKDEKLNFNDLIEISEMIRDGLK